MDNESVVEETQTVETETTTPSTSETETTPEVETSSETTSESPTTEEQPRAQARIQQLNRKVKELEEKASYWDALQAQPPAPPTDEGDGEVTVESIADAVVRKQNIERMESTRQEAAGAMQKDALDALTAHPDLETDDELAAIVVAYAEKNKLSFKAAADTIKSRMTQEQKKAESKVLATQAQKTGATSPSGARVSTGEMEPINLSNMTEEEKAANWSKILASYS